MDSLSAWSSGDCFQVNINSCGSYAVDSKCVTVLCWRQPKDFSFSIALLQLSSDSELVKSWLPGFSEIENWTARWHSLPQVVWDVAGWVHLALGKDRGIHPGSPADRHPGSLWCC